HAGRAAQRLPDARCTGQTPVPADLHAGRTEGSPSDAAATESAGRTRATGGQRPATARLRCAGHPAFAATRGDSTLGTVLLSRQKSGQYAVLHHDHGRRLPAGSRQAVAVVWGLP